MRLLLDSRSTQVIVHVGDGARLKTLIDELQRCGVDVTISDDRLDGLDGFDVVMIPTRHSVDENGFSQAELAALDTFINDGGGLLLMSNHGDWPGKNPHDHTRHDRALAAQFGVELEPAWFSRGPGELTQFDASLLSDDHAIFNQADPQATVRAVVTNNCSGIRANSVTPLISLNPSMTDKRNSYRTSDFHFGVALERTPQRKGRVVVLADSGFIGNEGTTYPGPGLIQEGDNLQFALNTVRWLGGEI